MQSPPGRRSRKLIPVATAVVAVSVGTGVASASGSGGGLATPGTPKLADVVCVQRCAGLRVATPGSRVELNGRNLDGVSEVSFAAAAGGRATVPADAASARSVEATVPDRAETGRVKASAYGSVARTPRHRRLRIVPVGRIPDAGDFSLSSAEARPQRSYFDGVRQAQVRYLFTGASATDVRVDVVNVKSQEVVSTVVDPAAEPNALNTVAWKGLTLDGRPAPNGEYAFRIGSAAGGSAVATGNAVFDYHQYRFPINARHGYGDGFGAGRGHQGQDVFARCASKLRAVRGGRVQMNKYQSAAGNYLVIDGKRTKKDFMYAHLLTESPLQQGARVHTGQVIGQVGETGNATGCHLHFEVWSGPGWYEGGDPLPSVTRLLKAWDSWT